MEARRKVTTCVVLIPLLLAGCAEGSSSAGDLSSSSTSSPMSSSMVLISAGPDSETFSPPPANASPRLTADQALAKFQMHDPEWTVPSGATVTLGIFDEATSAGKTFDNVLAYGVNYSYCLAPQHPVPSGFQQSCNFWLFVDANTGEMLQARDAPGPEPSPAG